MEDDPLIIGTKQREVLDMVKYSRQLGIEEIFLIGAIGTSKTFTMGLVHANVCLAFEDSIIPVARKDMAEAAITTWPVYQEALDRMGLIPGIDYSTREAQNDLRIKFANGSLIQFIGLNKSRDRDWSKAKVTSTMVGVDEVDDVDEGGYDTLFSRTGRRNATGAPRVMISACNPNDAWTKRKIYLPWLKSIGRRPDNMEDEEWDAIEPLPPSKRVVEFNMEDSFVYRDGYYDRFMERPVSWQQRYLYNNWNYLDDENSLFKSRSLDVLTIDKLQPGQKYIGVDPNAGGKDRAAIVLWEGDTIVDAEVYTTADLTKLAEPHELEPLNVGAILARLTIAMMKREGVGYKYVGGDVNGPGQGWYTAMLSLGYKVHPFISGAAPYVSPAEIAAAKNKNMPVPKPPYQMLRDQVFHKWSMDVENRRVYFYADMPHLSSLKKELQLHEADVTAKVLKVISKDDLKKLLGASPDIADSAVIGYWVRMITRPAKSSGQIEKATVGQSVNEMLYNQRNDF